MQLDVSFEWRMRYLQPSKCMLESPGADGCAVPAGPRTVARKFSSFPCISSRLDRITTKRNTVPQIITLRADSGTLEGFIDGFHSSSQPPLSVTGETAASVAQFRLGVVMGGDSSSPSYGSVDIAEVLIYDTALTVQEMDRKSQVISITLLLPAVE